jgi:hypothetical protein
MIRVKANNRLTTVQWEGRHPQVGEVMRSDRAKARSFYRIAAIRLKDALEKTSTLYLEQIDAPPKGTRTHTFMWIRRKDK